MTAAFDKDGNLLTSLKYRPTPYKRHSETAARSTQASALGAHVVTFGTRPSSC